MLLVCKEGDFCRVFLGYVLICCVPYVCRCVVEERSESGEMAWVL